MNINYHYYTIKTLALVAGFPEPAAQRIAHFSQYVDDCVLPRLVLTKDKPPQWFIDQKLAKQVRKKYWKVMLCSTGIAVGRSITDAFQCHTLVPFHFISPKPLPELKSASSRTAYRCVTATPQGEPDKGLLIDSLMEKLLHTLAQTSDPAKKDDLYVELGMLLHTYADSYAHVSFSGLRGYENQAGIDYAFDKGKQEKAIRSVQRKVYEALPSIGHTNVSTMPDVCYYKVSYTLESDESETIQIERDNTDCFAACSKNILHILCRITGASPLTDEAFDALQKDIVQAQTVDEEKETYLTPSWEKVFAHRGYRYKYDKHQYFKLRYPFSRRFKQADMSDDTMHDLLESKNSDAFDLFEPTDLADPYAVPLTSDATQSADPLDAYAQEYTDNKPEIQEPDNKAAKGRRAILVPMKGLNEDFYTYIQLAYAHILAVVGSYRQFQKSFNKHLEAHSKEDL